MCDAFFKIMFGLEGASKRLNENSMQPTEKLNQSQSLSS
jgi:hypothetical protein